MNEQFNHQLTNSQFRLVADALVTGLYMHSKGKVLEQLEISALSSVTPENIEALIAATELKLRKEREEMASPNPDLTHLTDSLSESEMITCAVNNKVELEQIIKATEETLAHPSRAELKLALDNLDRLQGLSEGLYSALFIFGLTVFPAELGNPDSEYYYAERDRDSYYRIGVKRWNKAVGEVVSHIEQAIVPHLKSYPMSDAAKTLLDKIEALRSQLQKLQIVQEVAGFSLTDYEDLDSTVTNISVIVFDVALWIEELAK